MVTKCNQLKLTAKDGFERLKEAGVDGLQF